MWQVLSALRKKFPISVFMGKKMYNLLLPDDRVGSNQIDKKPIKNSELDTPSA